MNLPHLAVRAGVFCLVAVLLPGTSRASDLPRDNYARAKLSIGFDDRAEPLSFRTSDQHLSGFTPELFQAASRSGPTEFVPVVGGWSFLLMEFKAGRIDALANVMRTPEREEEMNFSTAHALVHGITFTRAGVAAVRHTREFAGRRVAIVPGTILDLRAREHDGWGAHFLPFATRAAALDAVVRGKADCALFIRPSGDNEARQRGLESNFVEDLVFRFRVAVHKGDTRALYRVNEALAQAYRDGTFDRLYAKWIGPIEPRPIHFIDLRPFVWPGVLVVAAIIGLFLWQQKLLAERRDRANELAALLRASPALTFIAQDPRCHTITANKAALEVLHLPPGANTSKSIPVAEQNSSVRFTKHGRDIAPEDLPLQRAVFSGQPVYGAEVTITYPDGSERQVFGHAAPLFDRKGKVRGGVGTFLDITAHVESEARYRQLFENMLNGLFVFEVIYDDAHRPINYRLLYGNPAFEKLTGLRLQAVAGKVGQECGVGWPPEILARFYDVAAGGAPIEYRRFNETLGKWYDTRVFAPRPGQFAHVFTDVSEEQRIQLALRESEQRFRLQAAALEATDNSVVITDAQGTIEWVNPAFSRTTGYTAAEAIGQNPSILKSGQQSPEVYADLWRTITAGRSWSGEFINKKKDGSRFTEVVNVTPVRNDEGAITHYVAVKQNITERKALEQQLFQAQRLEAIGLLASGIAHDLNNIIAPIALSMELLRAKYPAETRTLDIISQCAKRGADIIRQVLTFSRGMDGTRMPLRFSRLVKEMRHLMGETLPRNIELVGEFEAKHDTVRVDPTQIHQVLLNLAVNARDAMPNGGKLTFTVSAAHFDEAGARLIVGARPGDYVVLAVADTGVGIPPEILPRIFEPFFTTKPRGQGTGLGLATVHGIIRSHGGFILVESTPGVGTTFRVYLPAEARAMAADPAQAALTPTAGRGRVVLVADDESSIREITEELLVARGFKVLLARDGKEAVEMFYAHRTEVDFVLLDRMMPVMGGEQAAAMIHQLEPRTPIHLTTGLINDTEPGPEMNPALQAAGVCGILRKPFSAETLMSVFSDHASA